MTPHYWETHALSFEADGQLEMAARCWRKASGASLGHARSERYHANARRCALKKARETWGPETKEDSERHESIVRQFA